MPERFTTLLVVLCFVLIGAGVLFYLAFAPAARDPIAESPGSAASRSRDRASPGTEPDPARRGESRAEAMEAALELAELDRILGARGAIEGEAILSFKTGDGFRRFLESAGRLGLRVLGGDARNLSLRIGFDSIGDLRSAFTGLDPGEYEVGANHLFVIPSIPLPDSPDNPGQLLVPFGTRALNWLGIAAINPSWGRGVTVAIMDTGIDLHSTFRDGQVVRIEFLDGASLAGDLGHGTAVASLVAGNDPAASGVAPGASLFSYGVTNASGYSDSFTLATAIYDAIARNVDIINISLGSYGNSAYLERAINDALAAGIAIVAAAGNEGQQGRLTYPAAYDGVISAGAVDALGEHVYYSNTSENLSIAAPGIGVAAAWEGDEFVSFSGTSASAPYVAGALAAIYSENPGIAPADAQKLLYDYANEAGLPGVDDTYGNGILDVGRVMDRNTPGIYDVAVASQTFSDPAVPTNNANPVIDVAIENRGTETLYNVKVHVSSTGIARDFAIPSLAPGAVAVLQAPIDSALVRTDGSLEVVSVATLTGAGIQDANQRDNRQTSVVSISGSGGP